MRLLITIDAPLTGDPKADYENVVVALDRAIGPASLYRLAFTLAPGDGGDIRALNGGGIGKWESAE